MSALYDVEKDKLFLCKYQINQLSFILEDVTVPMQANNILSMEKLDDYEFNIRSVIKLKLRVDIRQKLWILKNKKDLLVKMELDKVGIDPEAETELIPPEAVWNMEFGLYLNDDDESIDTSILEQSIQSNEGDEFKVNDLENNSYYEGDNVLDIYLFENKLYNASMKIYNKVFTSAPLQHAVGELLTETKHPKVLISKFENDEVYKELLVTPNPSYKGLIYLDQYYGFYKKGAIIYYDTDRLYIINPNGKVTAKEKDEWTETTFLITASTDSMPGNGMIRKPEEKIYYINIPEDNVSPQKPSIGENAAMGSKATVVVTDDIAMNTIEADQSYIDQRNEFLVYRLKSENKYSDEMLKTRMEENECIIYITADNVDMMAFAPNKEYKLIFEEPGKQERYGKNKYRLAYAHHSLKMESFAWMSSAHQFILKKC